MKLAEHSITINGNPQAVWNKLFDLQNMPSWDILMKSIHFEEPIRVGSIGKLVLKNGQTFNLRITQLNHMKDYTDEFSFLGTRFIFYHQMTEKSPQQVKMYLSIDCEGLLSSVISLLLSKEFNAKLVVLMTNFKEQFERDNILIN